MTTLPIPPAVPTAEDLTRELAQQLDSFTPEAMTGLLRSTAAFWRYSPSNVLLLQLQAGLRGFKPSLVAGFKEWEREGRRPLRGSVSLRVLAPISRTAYLFETGDGQKGRALKQRDVPAGATVTDRQQLPVRGYKAVPVFDVSQTEGAPIELRERPALAPSDAGSSLLAGLTAHSHELGFRMSLSDTQYSLAGGYTNHATREIVIGSWHSTVEQAAIAAHELAHAVLHGPDDPIGSNYSASTHDRGIAEVEAEAAAFLILQAHGIDSTERSANYLAGWTDATIAADGGDELSRSDVLRRTLARAHSVAKTTLLALDAPGGGKPATAYAGLDHTPAVHVDQSQAAIDLTVQGEPRPGPSY